jgi:predicted dehydrogenase
VLPSRLAALPLGLASAVIVALSAGLGVSVSVNASAAEESARPLRVGIIGLDTSHVVAFTRVMNGPKAPAELAGIRVVAAYPGGSPDVASSRDRIADFTAQLRDKLQVAIVDSIDELLSRVDVVLLESVDGRPHLEQVRPVLRAHKPVFIDKPMAGSLADAIEIARLVEETQTPCFSSSSLRFSPEVVALKNDPKIGPIQGCATYSPCSLEEHHPDLFWYGVHGVEMLYTLMGPGCEKVSRAQTKDTEFVTGVWKDGRIGTFRGLRGKSGYGALVFGAKGIVPAVPSVGYEPLLVEIGKFFRTGTPPVSLKDTVEILAFMEAADESKRQGGAPVTLESVMTKARAEAAARRSSAGNPQGTR